MTKIATQSVIQANQKAQIHGEQAIVNSLLKTATAAGIRADPLSIINLYVSVKSWPQIILVGPAQTGKISMIQGLAQVLVGDTPRQLHTMVGHARWAAHSQKVGLFVEAQARLNESKLFALTAEALRPENASRLFMLCLTRISPAELNGFFSLSGLRRLYQQNLFLNSEQAEMPLPEPLNLFLFGTMDAPDFRWWDSDLLSRTTIVHWPGKKMTSSSEQFPPSVEQSNSGDFLRVCIRSDRAAYAKLDRILQGIRQPFWPLMQVVDLLGQYEVVLPPKVINQVMVFLANAWTNDNVGLFDRSPETNLNIGLDLVLTQRVLPWANTMSQPLPMLRQRLGHLLQGHYTRAAAFVAALEI